MRDRPAPSAQSIERSADVDATAGLSAPRIAEEVGREYGEELASEIGLPEDAGFEAAVQAVARTMMGMGRRFRVAFVQDGRKWIVDARGNAELYDLRSDPNELTNLAAQKPDVVARLRGLELRARAVVAAASSGLSRGSTTAISRPVRSTRRNSAPSVPRRARPTRSRCAGSSRAASTSC